MRLQRMLGQLYSASCSGITSSAVCTAAGASGASFNTALLLSSNNGGATWANSTISGAPANAAFYGASNTGGTLAPTRITTKDRLVALLTDKLEIKRMI